MMLMIYLRTCDKIQTVKSVNNIIQYHKQQLTITRFSQAAAILGTQYTHCVLYNATCLVPRPWHAVWNIHRW